jgi:hypothetical protein
MSKFSSNSHLFNSGTMTFTPWMAISVVILLNRSGGFSTLMVYNFPLPIAQPGMFDLPKQMSENDAPAEALCLF